MTSLVRALPPFKPPFRACAGVGLSPVAICTTWTVLHTIAVALRLMTALVRYRIRLVAELNHRVRGFDADRQERRQEHERAFGHLTVMRSLKRCGKLLGKGKRV